MTPPKSSNDRSAADQAPRRSVMALTLVAGTCASSLPVLAAVVLLLSRNPHLEHGIDGTIAFYVATCVTFAAGALWALVELTQPTGCRYAWTFLLPAPLLLGAGVATELIRTPSSTWSTRMVGNNPAACFMLVSLFSLPILTGVFYVLRDGRVISPVCAGAIAGLLASSVAALVYVWHCPQLSPLYIATWHGLAVLTIAVIGAVLGNRFLRYARR
jgi:hypothetical protein